MKVNKSERIVRVGLVGCGQIADAHLQEIAKIENAEVVSVCDRQAALAGQAAARFEVPGCYVDLGEMLDMENLDVLHVTTPPTSHFPIAAQALKAGVNVYIEKPFTRDVREADQLLSLSNQCKKTVCVGHDQIFDPLWVQLKKQIDDGAVGDVITVYSTLNYDTSGPYGAAMASNEKHWVHSLPGGLLQNVISHPLYRITEFLTDTQPEITVSSSSLTECGLLPKELTVVLKGQRVTGILSFSTQCRPLNRTTRVCGTKSSIEIDFDAQTIRHHRPPRMRGAFGRVQQPWSHWTEATSNLMRNCRRFLWGDLQYFSGMNHLFKAFYQSIIDESPPPISHSEIRRVTWILDEIFRLNSGSPLQTVGAIDEVEVPDRTLNHEESLSLRD